MIVSYQARALLDTLRESTVDLLDILRRVALENGTNHNNGLVEAIDLVCNDLRIIDNGLIENDIAVLLKASNSLTTVNKGLGDMVVVASNRLVAEKAFSVSKDAIYAAKQLRADLGMPF